MTSLSSQLKSLQIPDELSVLNIQNKRASILFDAQDAADIDVDTVFALGVSGLNELQNIDQGFARFEKMLFSKDVKSIERSLLPDEFNKKLDKKINEFLAYLSPYFLIKPAQKTMEWLIRRFRINVFNIDALMSCVLPYHETNLFSRVLQIVTLGKQNGRWEWLIPVQKAGSPLSKITLIQHCVHEASFLTFICEMVPGALEICENRPKEKLKTLISFYASVLLGVIDGSKKITEQRVGKLLPFLYKGLKSEIDDLKASSYMILSKLCLVASLDEKIQVALIEQVCKSISGETAQFGILTLEYLYRTQSTKVFPTKALKKFCSSKENCEIFLKTAQLNDVSKLQMALIPAAVNYTMVLTQSETDSDQNVNYESVTQRFLRSFDLTPEVSKWIIRQFLEQFIKLRDLSSNVDSLMALSQRIMKLLETRYPIATDETLQMFLKKNSQPNKLVWIEALIFGGLKAAKYTILPGTQALLSVSLNHPDAQRRKLAVRELFKRTKSEENQENLNYAKDSLIMRLDDDELSVFEEVLAGGSSLLQIVGIDVVIEKLTQKLSSVQLSERIPFARQILELFKDSDDVNLSENVKYNQLIFELIPSILPSLSNIKQQLPLYKMLSSSDFASLHPLLAGIRKSLVNQDFEDLARNSSSLTELHMGILENLSLMLTNEGLNKDLIKSMVNFAHSVSVGHSFRSFLDSLLFKLFDKLTPKNAPAVIGHLQELLRSTVETLACMEGKKKDVDVLLVDDSNYAIFTALLSSKKYGSFTEKSKFQRINMFCLFLSKMLERGDHFKDLELQQFVFEVLATGSGRPQKNRPYVAVFRKMMQHFLKLNFTTSEELLRFLIMIFSDRRRFDWLSGRNDSFNKIDVQVCSLHIFKVCLENLEKSAEFMLNFESQVLPVLLVLLHHPLQVMREAAVSCIQVLNDVNTESLKSDFKYLFDCIIACDTEIITDMHHIQRVLEKLFQPLLRKTEDCEMLDPKHLENIRFLTKCFSEFISKCEQHVQLGIAAVTNSVVFQEFLVYLVPVFQSIIELAQTKGLSYEEFLLLKMLLNKFAPSTVGIFQKFPPSLNMFKTALELGKICDRFNSTVQTLALDRRACQVQLFHEMYIRIFAPEGLSIEAILVSPSFYSSIESMQTQNEIFDTILCSSITTSSLEVSKAMKEKLLQIPVSADDVARQISIFKEQLGDTNPTKAKRSKKMAKSKVEEKEVDSIYWNRITILLEILQQKTDFETTEKLVISLFEMLSCCLELTSTSQSSAEYMKQLLLSTLQLSIENIITSGNKGILAQDKFNIASVIQCCRTSQNPQTHHQALLLLGKAAKLFPDLVLHNIMTIFTFMGASVLRQDDSYSFEIIKKTIDSVIPALVQAGSTPNSNEEQKQQQKDVVKLVVRVFVDAVPYVPEHRRLILFEHLSTVLSAHENLYIVIAMLLEKMASKQQKKADLDLKGTDGSSLSPGFCQLLLRQFSAQIMVKTIEKLIHFISNLADENKEEVAVKRPTRNLRSQKAAPGELVPLFDVSKYTSKEIKHFKYSILTYISEVLSEESFVDEVLKREDEEMEDDYFSLLEGMMNFVCKIGKTAGSQAKDSSVKYWKALIVKTTELISKVYGLLSFNTFIHVTEKLLSNENATIRKKAIEPIAEKIARTAHFSYNQEWKLVPLTSHLIEISKNDSEETPINKQTALYALKFLFRVLSTNHAVELVKSVAVITEIFAAENANPQVGASALLCLAELCSCLGVRVVPHLPEFMPPVLMVFDDETNRNDLVLLSGLTVLHKALEKIPQFLSPYIVNILDIVTRLLLGQADSSALSVKANSVRGQITAKATALRQEIATAIVPRILLPALDTSLDKVIDSNQHSFQAFMEIGQSAMAALSREDAKIHNGKILTFFLKALDVRCLNSEKSQQEVAEAEVITINAFCTLTMKLSESLFRPMFLKIFNWATANKDNKDRLLTFYRLCGSIADKLKGLFLLFAGHIIKPCAELVQKCYLDKEESGIFDTDVEFKTDLLMRLIFDCLQKCFLHDSQGFLNKERFEFLLTPLVDQIENQLGGVETYSDRITNHLIPCVTSFAADVAEESGWKKLNHQILLKTRSPIAKVRLSALKMIEQIHKRIGEGYMVLLPESIPFLAELMEDEDFEVEKQCQQVITQMEEILGESLQKYF